jgi:YgiT-type zinc finger domain-containing protein
MVYSNAPFQVDRKGYHLMLDAVPAWVCTQCGEVYFEENEVDTIQDVLKTLDEQTEKFAVAV